MAGGDHSRPGGGGGGRLHRAGPPPAGADPAALAAPAGQDRPQAARPLLRHPGRGRAQARGRAAVRAGRVLGPAGGRGPRVPAAADQPRHGGGGRAAPRRLQPQPVHAERGRRARQLQPPARAERPPRRGGALPGGGGGAGRGHRLAAGRPRRAGHGPRAAAASAGLGVAGAAVR